jgi:hypothetical protein
MAMRQREAVQSERLVMQKFVKGHAAVVLVTNCTLSWVEVGGPLSAVPVLGLQHAVLNMAQGTVVVVPESCAQ